MKENQMKRLYTETNSQNDRIQKRHFYYKPTLYQSIFSPKSKLNKEFSDISKNYSQQVSQRKIKEKLNQKIIPKTDKRKLVIKPRNLKAKLFPNSNNKLYNSVFYQKNYINVSKSPNQNLSLNIKGK